MTRILDGSIMNGMFMAGTVKKPTGGGMRHAVDTRDEKGKPIPPKRPKQNGVYRGRNGQRQIDVKHA